MDKEKNEKVIDSKVLPIPMLGREIGRFEGHNFYIAEYDYGVVFHLYNSMDLIVRRGQESAFEGLCYFIRIQELYDSLSEDDKKNIQTYAVMVATVLASPLHIFSNLKESDSLFKDIYKSMGKYLNQLEKRLEKMESSEETVLEDEIFKDTVLSTISAKNQGD